MYKTKCNPKVKKKYCMSDNMTYKIKEKWNNKNTRKIKEESPHKILLELFSLNSKCQHEICILKTFFSIHDQNFLDELDNYAPIAPETWKKNKNTWLTTKDIRKVLNQYDKLYTNFRFIGPSPIDWFEKAKTTNSCVCRYLCELNYDNLVKDGIEKVGIVFNLDEHYKKGSHWVALYIDVVNKHIYYFDSAGDKCPIRIKKIYHKLNINKDFKFSSNYGVRHQKGKTECGIYVIYFILSMLKYNNYKLFNDKKNLIPDIQMENYRDKYFNKLE